MKKIINSPELQLKLNNINEEVLKKIELTLFENIKKTPAWATYELMKPLKVEWKFPLDNEEKRNKEFRNYVVWNYPMSYTAERNSVIKYFNDIDNIKEPSKLFRVLALITGIIGFIMIWGS